VLLLDEIDEAHPEVCQPRTCATDTPGRGPFS
jgi:hypothetical protein